MSSSPEVVKSLRLVRRHLEVLNVEGLDSRRAAADTNAEGVRAAHEVSLALQAVLVAVALQTVVAVGLVITGSDHPGLLRGDRRELVEELLRERLVALGILLLRRHETSVVGTKVALSGLLEELRREESAKARRSVGARFAPPSGADFLR